MMFRYRAGVHVTHRWGRASVPRECQLDLQEAGWRVLEDHGHLRGEGIGSEAGQ